MQIHTSLDLRLQRVAERAVELGTAQIEEEHIYRETFASFRESRANDRTAELLTSRRLSSHSNRRRADPRDGRRTVLEDSRFNRAVQARASRAAHQALHLRIGDPSRERSNDIVIDEPVSYRWGTQHRWDAGRRTTSRTDSKGDDLAAGLARSINIPSVKLLDEIGPRRVVDFAHACGLSGDIRLPVHRAGTAEVTPLEMAGAYGARAISDPRPANFVTRIEDRIGRLLLESKPVSSRSPRREDQRGRGRR